MSIARELKHSLKELERDLDRPQCTFRSVDYYCSVSTLERGTTLIIGGKEVDISMVLRIRKSGFLVDGAAYAFTSSTVPVDGNTITYDGTVYKIVRADDAIGAFVTLHLTSINR